MRENQELRKSGKKEPVSLGRVLSGLTAVGVFGVGLAAGNAPAILVGAGSTTFLVKEGEAVDHFFNELDEKILASGPHH